MTDQQTTTVRPVLAVRRPRPVEGSPVEGERDAAHLEAVLASLSPGA